MSIYIIFLPDQETGRNIHLINRSTAESLLEINYKDLNVRILSECINNK